jgi:3-oxoacyl-[acyl-carrier protein] reductase
MMNHESDARSLPGAIVTGSSRGIGAAVARRLGALGYGVCVNYLANEDRARGVAEEIEGLDGRAIVVRADVGDRAQVGRMIEETVSAFGGIRIVVNNAGFSQHKTLGEMTAEDWNRAVAVNLSAAMFTVQASLPFLTNEPWARVVNICSLRAMTGSDHGAHYAAAKSGLIGLTKSLALELAPSITVNAVSPGYARTDMNAAALATREDEIAAKIPARRIAEPDEIAAVVAFLASEEAGYVTGQTINANGGLFMQ